MELRIERDMFTQESTTGRLFIDGNFECVTLEPTLRPTGVKITGRTAIPAGRYKVALSYSPHFKRITPHVLDVPNFSEIEMHVGNYPKDTEGCTLLGRVRVPDCLHDSVAAVDALYNKLHAYLATVMGGEIWVTYENCPAPGQQMPLGLEVRA